MAAGKPVKTNATNSSTKAGGSKRRKMPVSAATVEEDVPVEDVVDSAPEAESATEPAAGSESDTKPKQPQLDVTTLIAQLKEDVIASIATMKLVAAKVRELEKAHNKEKRAKGSRKRKSPDTETATEPKPEKLFEIEEPLRDFLQAAPGEKVGKKAARRAISNYITTNGLQDPANLTLIKPDEKLANLFGPPRFVTTKGQLGYSNLNALRYIQNYFITPVVETPPTAAEVVVSA